MPKVTAAQKAARDRLASSRAEMDSVSRRLREDLQVARSWIDPASVVLDANTNMPIDLPASASTLARRQELATQARDRASAEVARIREQLAADSEMVRSWADSARPRVSDDVVSLTRSSMAWEKTKALLDAGRSLPSILATADRDTVLALQEWWPTWVTVQTKAEPDRAIFQRSIDRRLGELEPDFAEAAGALSELSGVTALVRETGGRVEHAVASKSDGPISGLEAAFAAHYADQFARAAFVDDSGAEAPQDAA